MTREDVGWLLGWSVLAVVPVSIDPTVDSIDSGTGETVNATAAMVAALAPTTRGIMLVDETTRD